MTSGLPITPKSSALGRRRGTSTSLAWIPARVIMIITTHTRNDKGLKRDTFKNGSRSSRSLGTKECETEKTKGRTATQRVLSLSLTRLVSHSQCVSEKGAPCFQNLDRACALLRANFFCFPRSTSRDYLRALMNMNGQSGARRVKVTRTQKASRADLHIAALKTRNKSF
jgi:hypothetical protein